MPTVPSSQLSLISDRLSLAELEKLESGAKQGLRNNKRRPHYMLVNAEYLVAMIAEIKELRLLAHPDSLTLAYMAGVTDARQITNKSDKTEIK